MSIVTALMQIYSKINGIGELFAEMLNFSQINSDFLSFVTDFITF